MEVLDELAQRSDLDAADFGWILVQRARANNDAGRGQEAESDATRAIEKLLDRRDVAGTALAGAATAAVWGIVAARNFEEANIGGLLTASDNAVSWWRSQTISRALTSAADKQFDFWAEKRFLLRIGGDGASADLFAAELNADLVGDHGIWQQISSLKARQRMMSAATSRDEVNELIEGLDALRGSGDESSLESAISHLRQVGPIEAVAKSVNKIPSARMDSHHGARELLRLTIGWRPDGRARCDRSSPLDGAMRARRHNRLRRARATRCSCRALSLRRSRRPHARSR